MISCRIADEADTHIVSKLLGDLFEEVGHSPTASEIADIFLQIDSADFPSTLLALDDDQDVVGVLTIVETLALYAGGRIGVVNELYVVPAYRSEGVGKMLLDEAKALAEERGWVRLEVTTPGEDYPKTLRFYEREGFMAIGPRYKYLVD
jgi:GNAT superfamily N-acetyltransferase